MSAHATNATPAGVVRRAPPVISWRRKNALAPTHMAATPMYFAGACLRGARLARARTRPAAGAPLRTFGP
jgi:hypothetical protein